MAGCRKLIIQGELLRVEDDMALAETDCLRPDMKFMGENVRSPAADLGEEPVERLSAFAAARATVDRELCEGLGPSNEVYKSWKVKKSGRD